MTHIIVALTIDSTNLEKLSVWVTFADILALIQKYNSVELFRFSLNGFMIAILPLVDTFLSGNKKSY